MTKPVITEQDRLYLSIANLYELNTFFLNALQKNINNGNHKDLLDLYNQCESKYYGDNTSNTQINLLHQGVFIGGGYLALVLVWEKIKDLGLESDFIIELEQKFDFNQIAKTKGPRVLDLTKEKIRLIRNAVSHGNIITGDPLQFYDQNKYKNAENEPTFIKIGFKDFGKLFSDIISCANEIYKKNDTQ